MKSVVVKLKEHEISTVTDKNGEFKLWIPEDIKTLEFSDYGDRHIQEIKFITPDEVHLIMASDEALKNLFNLTLEELMEVKLTTAGKKEEKISDIPASAVVITRNEIETYGYTSWEEILEYVLGMYKIDEYHFSGTENFGVRGFYSPGFNTNVAILVNGVKQMEAFANSFNTAFINVPVEAIDRIEVVRGPMSVIYGSNAFFGAINIITNQQKNNLLVTAGYGNYNRYKTFARVSKGTNDYDFTFNVGVVGDDGLSVPYGDMISSSQEWWQEAADLTQTTEERLEERSAYFGLSGRYKGFYSQITYNQNLKDVQQIMPALHDGHSGKFSAVNFLVGYKKDFSDKFKLDVKVTGYEFNYYAQYSVFFNRDYFAYNSTNSKAFEAEAIAQYSPLSKINITLGLVRNTAFRLREEYDVPAFGEFVENNTTHLPEDEKINTNSVYSQIDVDILDNLTLVGGLRFEQTGGYDAVTGKMVATGNEVYYFGSIDKTDIVFIPRAALIYRFLENHSIKLLYGEATKNPSYNQNYANIPFTDIAPLKPERIRTYEINYFGKVAGFMNANLSVFRNELSQLIYEERDDVNNVWWNANGGEVNTNGLELSLLFKPTDWFDLNVSGTYLDTKDEKSDIEMAFSPNYILYGNAAFRLPHSIKFALSGRYMDSMLSSWNPTAQKRNGIETDAYMVVNANIRAEKIFKGLFAELTCSNLFDREIRYPTGDNNAFFDKGTLGKGRAVFFSLGYRF